MRKGVFLLLSVICIFLVAAFFLVSFSKAQQSLVSPWIEKGRTASNLWFPEGREGNLLGVPQITAKAAYFVEINSGEVLYQKNPSKKLPIASLVKIMTAILSLENKNWDDRILISQKAALMEPDHMRLQAGEILTVKELLYGLFLVSANDAAEALAEEVVVNREEFIDQMNKKALQLGMKDTLFINPSGLQEEGREQYSTAYDVVLMSRYAVKNLPGLLEISSTPHIILPQTETHQDYDLYSGINLLTTYPGVKGLKTGFTPEAGLTLITFAQKEGKGVLGVLLASENRREEARELLDYSFKKLGV